MELYWYKLRLDPVDQIVSTLHVPNGTTIVAGHYGWDLILDTQADLRKLDTINMHVMVLNGERYSGVYLTRALLEEMLSSHLSGIATVTFGSVRMFRLGVEVNARWLEYLERNMPDNVDFLKQRRSAEVCNALLGLAQHFGIPPAVVS